MGTYARRRPERLAEKLLAVREAFGDSQNGLIRRLGIEDEITQSDLSAFERGTREPPLHVLLRYSELARVWVNALIDPYDADRGSFTLVVDDPEDPVFNLPIPRDEARKLKANLDGAVFEGVYRLSAAPPSPRPSPRLVAVRVTSSGKVYETATRAGILLPTRKALLLYRPEPGYTAERDGRPASSVITLEYNFNIY